MFKEIMSKALKGGTKMISHQIENVNKDQIENLKFKRTISSRTIYYRDSTAYVSWQKESVSLKISQL